MEKTFTYTVSEKNDKQANVTYDGKTHKVTVTLTDDGKGQLHTAVSYDDGGKVPEFVNTYTEPAKPAAPNLLGKTGAAISGGAVLMLLLLGAGLMLRKGAGSTRGAHRA